MKHHLLLAIALCLSCLIMWRRWLHIAMALIFASHVVERPDIDQVYVQLAHPISSNITRFHSIVQPRGRHGARVSLRKH